jgi:menaquinone-9 beta-reductase
LQCIQHGMANLCLLVWRNRFAELEHRWENIFKTICAESPHLGERLEHASFCFTKPLAMSAIPYGYVAEHADGVWRLGDQAAVIPSFSGDGLSLALHSAHLAAQCFLRRENAEAFQQQFAECTAKQVRLVTNLSRLLIKPS